MMLLVMMMIKLMSHPSLILSFITIISSLTCLASSQSCGYESCPPLKEGAINVHIVCHTHLDTGWVVTYDEYFERYVRGIYNSVLQHLPEKSNRKFIAVETSFFSRWYNELDRSRKNLVHRLVDQGQLEFISGGWSMNDEACPNYLGIINQMTLGHKWLNQTFGDCGIPKIGWQIDPFGHSREYASILSQMAFDGLFLGRIDYQDKDQRMSARTLEFLWKSSPSLGKRSDIMTGVLPNVYWPPSGFCYDYNCNDEQVHEGNAQRKAREFIDRVVRPYAKMYATNNTIITMGMDFYYRDALKWFSNLDTLIEAVNQVGRAEGVHMFYSTPSCYLKSLYDAQIQWPVKVDDFFPYADAFNTYWSGYYSSRAALKLFMRYSEGLLQVAKQLNVLSLLGQSQASLYAPLEQTLGILHHHDAITGTCKQRVADDYAHSLHQGIRSTEEAIVASMNRLLFPRGPLQAQKIYFCHTLNTSHCEIVQSMSSASPVLVHVYNPIANPIKTYIKLPVSMGSYEVIASDNSIVDHQILDLAEFIRNLPERDIDIKHEILFRASLPALGFTSFIVRKKIGAELPVPQRYRQSNLNYNEVVIENSKISLIFDSVTGLMKEIVLADERRLPFRQNFFIYQGSSGTYSEKASGAYAFNPIDDEAKSAASKVTWKINHGRLVQEFHQTFNEFISQTIRLYQHSDAIEFEWVIGPIPKDRWFGREIVTRYETDFQSNATFWTDANGRETIRRTRNHRVTWNLKATKLTPSNYYPISSWTFIRDYDRNLQLTVLPDRPEGGSSLSDGTLELMLHRRLFFDDGFGMDEALDEPGVDDRGLIIRGRHQVLLTDIRTGVQRMRTLSKSLTLPPLSMFRSLPGPATGGSFDRIERVDFSGLHRKLPFNIHLLSLERWDDRSLLIRLEHFFEINEDLKYSRPRRVSLRDLFEPIRIVSAREMTLNGVEERRSAEKRRLRFVSRFDPYSNYTNLLTQIDPQDRNVEQQEPLIVILYPMNIKTYLVTFEAKVFCTDSPITSRNRNRVMSVDC